MDEVSKEHIRAAFSEITGRLEDASLLALKGQSQDTDAQTSIDLAQELVSELVTITNDLQEIVLAMPAKD